MSEVVVMPEPQERTPNDVMQELAASIVRARDLAEELLELDPHATEPPDSLLSEERWGRLEDDLYGWRYQFDHAIDVISSNTDCLNGEHN